MGRTSHCREMDMPQGAAPKSTPRSAALLGVPPEYPTHLLPIPAHAHAGTRTRPWATRYQMLPTECYKTMCKFQTLGTFSNLASFPQGIDCACYLHMWHTWKAETGVGSIDAGRLFLVLGDANTPISVGRDDKFCKLGSMFWDEQYPSLDTDREMLIMCPQHTEMWWEWKSCKGSKQGANWPPAHPWLPSSIDSFAADGKNMSKDAVDQGEPR